MIGCCFSVKHRWRRDDTGITTFYLKFGYKIKVNSIVFPCFLKKVSLSNEFINRSVDPNIHSTCICLYDMFCEKVIPETCLAHPRYLPLYHYHSVETSAGGLLFPKGIISPVVSVPVLAWFIRYIYYWNLQFLNNVINTWVLKIWKKIKTPVKIKK
jgi:hypothetical protein